MDCEVASSGLKNGTPQLLRAIIVLNEKYFPDSETSAAKVGATSFALSAARCLQDAGIFAGMILYRRREEICKPIIDVAVRNGTVCCVLSFNFHMEKEIVKVAIRSAALQLDSKAGMGPMLYYQTDTLLGYHPEGIPCCVTHHGPFVADIVQHFSVDDACIAFGSVDKAMHLMRQQQAGLQYLLHRKDMFVLQHSDLQRKFLLRCGIDPNRIRRLRPPIQAFRGVILGSFCDQQLADFVESNEMLLFTAVARLDFFKNVELLVDAGVELLKRGIRVRVLLVGGDADDEDLRTGILRRVPLRYAQQFMAVEKLEKDALYSLFRRASDKGVFVCSSRYETLGITPLEAALNGVKTLIVDSQQVEASRFFPEGSRFGATVGELAQMVEKLHGKDMGEEGEILRTHVERDVSEKMFGVDLLLAWSQFSETTYAESRVRGQGGGNGFYL